MTALIRTILLTLVASLWTSASTRADERAQRLEHFEKHVRPVLVKSCYRCHSKDAKRLKGGLRLDSRTLMLKGGDTGPAIVPEHPEKSLLIKAIEYKDVNLQMPPRSKLEQKDIDHIVKWIEDGAVTPEDKATTTTNVEAFDLEKRRKEHWAFQPIQRDAPPQTKNPRWARNPIDRFILAKLEENKLQPAKETEKRIWLRRVTFDLIGLPPTPEEMDAFLADDSRTAYEKVVDRLLASPQYGERWARHWLDLVRYAETQGHEFDFEMPYAFEYRDYVIRALNRDVPYRQFVIEHLAGDLLKKPRRDPINGINESVIGTGFFFLGEGKHSPVDIRGEGANRTDNQIDVLSKTFLAMTIGCARCHDHKFDALSARDYAALSGYVRSSRFHHADINPPEKSLAVLEQIQKAQGEQQSLAVQMTADSLLDSLDGFATQLMKTKPGRSPGNRHFLHPWNALGDSKSFTEQRKAMVAQWKQQQKASEAQDVFKDFSRTGMKDWFVTGYAQGDDVTTSHDVVIDPNKPRPVQQLRGPGVAHSGRYGSKLQGTLRSPSFTINSNRIHYLVGGSGAKVRLIIDGFQIIRAPIYGGIQFGVNSGERLVWRTMDVHMWKGHRAYVELLDEGNGWFALKALAFTDGGPTQDDVNDELLKMLEDDTIQDAKTLAMRSEQMLRDLVSRWKQGKVLNSDEAEILEQMLQSPLLKDPPKPRRKQQNRLRALARNVRQLEGQMPTPRKVMALVDGTGENEHLFIRGNHKNPGPEVPRRFYEAIAGKDQPEPEKGSGRLALALRMIGDQNPLLPRVMVNRLWKHHFGRGIVASPDDFGKQGQRPTHPELLDWLADEFVASGWSIKKMHRLMVLSSTYRMASQSDSASDVADPTNQWVHRMPIRRLEAEAIRDAVLQVSGRLDDRMYGRGVVPHLTPYMTGRGRPRRSGPVDGEGRRSIYLNVRRNFLTPFFLAFDYPTPFTTIGKRSVSSVPAQALAMMNNPFVRQQAQIWAQQILADPNASVSERITRLYRVAFGRAPTTKELESATGFIASVGNPKDLRAWTELCHVLFNVKEFIFIN